MARTAAPEPQVARRLHEPDAKVMLPDAIDDHAARQGMVAPRQPTRELTAQATRGRTFGRFFYFGGLKVRDARKGRSHARARLAIVPANHQIAWLDGTTCFLENARDGKPVLPNILQRKDLLLQGAVAFLFGRVERREYESLIRVGIEF